MFSVGNIPSITFFPIPPLSDREQCIYIGHDWGAIIGWEFVSKHHDMVQKYVLMGAPSNKVFTQLIKTSKDQAKRTWYFIFFQMPVLPELLFKANDLAFFFKLWDNKFNESFTKDDLEAYKYVFQQKGLNIHLILASFGLLRTV